MISGRNINGNTKTLTSELISLDTSRRTVRLRRALAELYISFHNESVGTATVHGCNLEALSLQSLQSAYRHLQLGHTRGHHIWLHRFIHCRRNCRHELPVRQGPRHVDVRRVLVFVRRKGGQHLVTKAECERAGSL